MSQRRQIPKILLCLVTICLLIFAAVRTRSAHQHTSPTASPASDTDSASLRYPASLVQPSNSVVLAEFTFEPPPLPDQSSSRRLKRAETSSDHSVDAGVLHSPQTTERHVVPQQVASRFEIHRLPPIPRINAEQTQPVNPAEPVSGDAAVKEEDDQVWRLPPVVKVKDPIVPKPVISADIAQNARVADEDEPVERALLPVSTDSMGNSTPPTSKLFPAAHRTESDSVEFTTSQQAEEQSSRRVASQPTREILRPIARPAGDFDRDRVDFADKSPIGTSIIERSDRAPVFVAQREPVIAIVDEPIAVASESRGIIRSITPGPPANRIPGPNPALVAVSRQAMDLLRSGQSLAIRNAQYSARADFVQALRLIAQAHDALEGGSQHSRDLSAGMLALREAKDFIPNGNGRWTDQFDVRVIAAAHGTPILRELKEGNARAADMTPWRAQQEYYTFAQQKLAEAVAGEAVASAALFSLGKLYVGRDGTSGGETLVSSAQAMAFFQSALQVDSRNYNAANELGVLLARYGQLQDARKVLQHGVAIKKDYPPLWNNLSVVHQRQGEVDLMRRARHEFELAQHRVESGQAQVDAGNSIRWVDAEAFADLTPAPPRPRTAARPPTNERETESQKPSWRFWK